MFPLGSAVTPQGERRPALAAGPRDPAAAHCNLAEAYLVGGDRIQARRQTLAALEIASGYERAQELLLKLVDEPQ